MRKVTLIGAYAFGGLVCTLIAPQAQAQLTLHKESAVVSVTESSLNFSDTLLLPQFQKIVHNANATLYGVDITQMTNASIFGTITNTSAVTSTVTFEGGALVNSTLPNGTTLGNSALTLHTVPLAPGASYTFSANPVGTNTTGLVTTGLSAFQGSGTFATTLNGTGFLGFIDPNGYKTSNVGTNGVTTTEKVTFWYYAPFTPVPELGTSISLGLMGLVGGALGLRARRRAR